MMQAARKAQGGKGSRESASLKTTERQSASCQLETRVTSRSPSPWYGSPKTRANCEIEYPMVYQLRIADCGLAIADFGLPTSDWRLFSIGNWNARFQSEIRNPKSKLSGQNFSVLGQKTRVFAAASRSAGGIVQNRQDQMMFRGLQLDFLSLGENLVSSVGFVPFGQAGCLMHVFDDLPPPHARIVSAEGNLPFLGSVRYDAHLGAPEVIGPQVLKPHTFDAEHAPVILIRSRLHAVIPVTVRSGSAGLEQTDDLGYGESFGSCARLEVAQD